MGIFDRYSKGELKKLQEFVRSNRGVEAYIEPKTTTQELTLLLVAADGKWIRGPIADLGNAQGFCKRLDIPLYEAAVVGYPKRMKGKQQAAETGAPTPTAEELEAWFSHDPGEK